MTASDVLLSILASQRIEARKRFGMAKGYQGVSPSVCFSEAPLHQLTRMVERRGCFGLGFEKEYIVQRGGGPVLYAYQGTPHADALEKLIRDAADEPNHPIWTVAPFIERPGEYGTSSYFFEWEREWRHPGHFSFAVTDPALLILPEDLHESARLFFTDAEVEQVGPNYQCTFIDPGWSNDLIQNALKSKT